jgi:ketosteroid isomerase-like protein
MLLAAHCLGDADLMADLSAPETVIASRGRLYRPSREATRAQFTSAFEKFDYEAYIDLEPPVISIAQSGDLGIIAVNVRAVGRDRETDEAFTNRWAWFMTVAKIDGHWLHTGNASNLAE